MKGRFSKFFAVTALLLSICCLSAAPVSVHANAFDNVRANVTQTQHTKIKKVKLSKKAKKSKKLLAQVEKLHTLIVNLTLPHQSTRELTQPLQ